MWFVDILTSITKVEEYLEMVHFMQGGLSSQALCAHSQQGSLAFLIKLGLDTS